MTSRTPLKKTLQVVTENFMKIILDMVNQNVQETLKKFQDIKNKEYEKTQEQRHEIIGALKKHQSETEDTINREINELKMKIENIKEEVTHDMKNLRKKNETETQNTMEGHSSRLEQAKDRISKLEDKMEIQGKTEELLVKQLKTCERNMQELTDSIKRPNLRIMGIEEGQEVQTKGICNIFNKMVTENFPNLEKTMHIQIQETSRTPNRLEIIIIETTSTKNRERILRTVREKNQITYKGKPIKITADFSMETLKGRRAWSEVFQALNENNFNPRIFYTAKLSFKIDKAKKVFHDKQKLKQYMTTKPPLQKVLQGILHTESESKQNHERAGSTKPQEKKRKENRE
jgi:membrane-associated HD superfamily phosphohydrolase